MSDKSIQITTEDARQAAPKLTQYLIDQGYVPSGFYPYTDKEGIPLFWRIRLDHPTKGKWIRPLSFNGSEWKLEEPNFPKGGKPLYRLHEIVSRPNETVWIVEGEKCADALAELGLLATTSGGATSANGVDWSPLSGRRVIIWPDYDQPGNQYAKDVAKALVDLAHSVEVVDIEPLNLHEHGDCFDWLRMNPNASRADIEGLKLVDPIVHKLIVEEWEEPRPLKRQLPEPDVFPIDVLGSNLGGVVKKWAEVIQAPPAICGQSGLAAVALAVQGYANVEIEGRICPLSEFFLTIGDSGERKSAVDRCALTPHEKYQDDLRIQYEDEFTKYTQESEVFKKGKEQALSKKKTSQDRLEAIRALGDEPVAPLIPLIISEEPTYEGLIKNLEFGYPSQGLFSDEGGRFVGGHGMGNDNILKTVAGLCGLWDGKRITRVRSGDGASILSGRRLSLHLMLQPNVAQILLSNSLLTEQGFLSRFLVAYPISTAGTRFYKEENLWVSSEMKRYQTTMADILNSPLPTGRKLNELAPININLEPQAKILWMDFHDSIERKLGKDGELAAIRGLAGKASEHAIRLAGILTVYDRFGFSKISNFSKVSIDLEHMRAGIRLTTHYLSEALRLFNAEFIDPDILLAEKLLDWLRNNGKSPVPLDDIYQYGPTEFRVAKTARNTMKILEEHGWLKPLEGGADIDGIHKKEAWKVKL